MNSAFIKEANVLKNNFNAAVNYYCQCNVAYIIEYFLTIAVYIYINVCIYVCMHVCIISHTVFTSNYTALCIQAIMLVNSCTYSTILYIKVK